MIDVALAGANAVVAGLPPHHKRPAIRHGDPHPHGRGHPAASGDHRAGVRLLSVGWKMCRELQRPHQALATGEGTKTLRQAMDQIILADMSMGLAVTGAHDRLWVLATGMLLPVALMGLAAGLIARLLEPHRWIASIGRLIILYVAVTMVWHDEQEVAGAV